VLAVGEGLEAVVDRGDRVAGALDDDVDGRVRDERAPVLADVRAAILQRRLDRRRLRALGRPTHAHEVGARALG
jgi:hypothetical protein